jgi:hypothetical protein
MKIMTIHGSAIVREHEPHISETPHVTETTTHVTETTQITISDALKRRAQSVINDRSIDPRWRTIVRYGLETNDPWLPDLVRRADAGETISDTLDFSLEPKTIEDDSSEAKVEALAEIICRAGDEPAAALFVLMGTLEHSTQPKLLANTAKHFAFARCGESDLYGIVDAQIAVVESELLAGQTDFS